MNKNAIKLFATQARLQLRTQIAQQAGRFGMTETTPVQWQDGEDFVTVGTRQYPSGVMRATLASLELAWHQQGYQAVIDEVAYTWFNRLVAIRFMEVHDYLPSHLRVLSSRVPGTVDPDILGHYHELVGELGTEKVADFDALMVTGQREAVFRGLLMAQCRQLHTLMPFLFEPLNDYTELLLPENLLQTGSVIHHLVEDIPEEDFQDVEIIGWLYQYYIADKNKEIVGMNKGVVSKEDLPAATQLFTPRWVVQYMVENSLGRIWINSHPNSRLSEDWPYYLFRNQDGEKTIVDVESLEMLDPACGSGHILVVAFDMLYKMYEELGYASHTIPALILQKNLYGLDIDPRATQLAMLALVMKAREKDVRFFQRRIIPKILAFQDAEQISDEALQLICRSRSDMKEIHDLLVRHGNARQFGSLLNGELVHTQQFLERIQLLQEGAGDLVAQELLSQLQTVLIPILNQNEVLSKEFDVVVTNPPYHNKYNPALKDFMARHYAHYKGDLYSAFIYRCAHWTREDGYAALMTPFTWMFISSHEKLRQDILQNLTISSLVQLEYSGFDGATVPICTFVLQRQTRNTQGIYLRLDAFKGPEIQPVKVREAAMDSEVSYRYIAETQDFSAIPGSPIAYWASDAVCKMFREGIPLHKIAEPKVGLQTSDNNRFLRHWYEVNVHRIGFGYSSAAEALESQHKWFPLNKGGEFRKWYGNQEYVVNWENDGKEIKNFRNQNGKVMSRPQNIEFYFLPAITWTDISSSKFGVRFSPEGFIFDHTGNCIFPDESDVYYINAYLCTSVASNVLKYLNPTLHFQVGNIASLPLIMDDGIKPTVDRLAQENIAIAQEDWDAYETSWNFRQHPLVQYRGTSNRLAEAFEQWSAHASQQFRTMQAHETELNRLFIDLYGLNVELTPDVPDEDITLRLAERKRDAQSFLSYFVGCLMGRYSLDAPGLIYAGGPWDPTRYSSFAPVEDGMVVLTDSSYFAQDIIQRLEEFLTVLYGASYLGENLQWLADSLEARATESATERLRRYFLQDFFKAHSATYKKRPIYWLFSAGPRQGFQALLYGHRYTTESVARVRLQYLQPLQMKVAAEITQSQARIRDLALGPVERRAVDRRIELLGDRQAECARYDQILAELADQRVTLDLDDGVLGNVAKLAPALAPIK